MLVRYKLRPSTLPFAPSGESDTALVAPNIVNVLMNFPPFVSGAIEVYFTAFPTHLLVADELPNPVTREHQEIVFRFQDVLGNLWEGDDAHLPKQSTEIVHGCLVVESLLLTTGPASGRI